jgi:site-specific DNA-methyltransferase (cytosine-N4-specific)
MRETVLEWRNYRYFPYERDFACVEVERLFQVRPRDDVAGLRIPAKAFHVGAAERLTYFSRVVHPGGTSVVPLQARLEASAHVDERERQATRYSAHGLHEYKGKFNPQVVRAIGNILGLNEGAWILDPFCGSGTTLLECAHIGWNAVGVDRNPLAVRIANAKIRALHQADGPLEAAVDVVAKKLEQAAAVLSGSHAITGAQIDSQLGEDWVRELPSWEYLLSWFPLPVLAQVVAILRVLRAAVPSAADRAVFEVILSDHLRDVSLQEPADLRIRRRKDPQPNYPLIKMFTEALQERITRVGRARCVLGSVSGCQRASLGDIRNSNLHSLTGRHTGGFDAVITSPPYESALPYIDTQRLSLVLFGDVKAAEIQNTERELIGAREIRTRERKELEEAICSREQALPAAVVDLCRELLAAAAKPGNGFRRRNRPALVYWYFKSMREFFMNIRCVLRPNAKVALVVGTNRTVLGGREYVIDTPRLLAAVAEHCGYHRVEERPMDTYPRYAVHQRNSIDSEMLIVLAAP